MSAKNQPHGSTGHQSNDTPPNRVGDTREGAQDDSSTDDDKTTPEPPHGHISHGVARFLAAVDPDTPLDELGEAYARWKASGDSEQATVSRWSE